MPDLGIGSQIAPQALKTLEQAMADDPLERIELQLPRLPRRGSPQRHCRLNRYLRVADGRDLLCPFRVVCRRPAFEIDFARGERRDACFRRHGHEVDAQIMLVDLVADRIHDRPAKVDRVADRLLVRSNVAKGERRLAITQRYRPGFVHLGEGPGETLDPLFLFLGPAGARKERKRE
jgi:hypothetical protein